MPIHIVSGDLFANRYRAQAFAQGCNCQGFMGAGIAKNFRAQYPDMFAAYQERCQTEPRQFNVGDAFLWKDERRPWVFNLATQEHYWRSGVSYEAVREAFDTMRKQADTEQISSIALTRIKAGYAKLSWRKIRQIIEQIFAGWEGDLYIYDECAPEVELAIG